MLSYFVNRSLFIRDRIPYSVWYTLSFVCGILWQINSISLLFSCLIIIIALIGLAPLQHILYQKVIILLMFFLGSWRQSMYEFYLQTVHHNICEKPIALKIRILDNNYISTTSLENTGTILAQVLSANHATTNQSIPTYDAIIQITSRNNHLLNACHYGDILLINKAWIQRPTQNILYSLQRSHAVASTKIGMRQSVQQHQPSAGSFLTKCHRIKKSVIAYANKTLSPLSSYLFCSIFLGFCSPKDTDAATIVRTSFAWWGISHYLARSGLHLALLATATQASLTLLPLQYALKQLIILLLLAIYTLFSWPSISFLRSGIMILGNIVCIFLKIPYDSLHALMYTTMILLLYNPFYLMSLEFQLSFFITLGLILSRHASHINKLKE